MPSLDLVVMAHSRKHQGRCIACLRSDGEGWVRPVPPGGGPLMKGHIRLDDRSMPQSLDLIRIEVDQPAPDQFQPENWAITDAPWKLLKRPAPDESLRALESIISPGPHLFSDYDDKIHKDVVCAMPDQGSLDLVEPLRIEWDLRDDWQARVKFRLGFARYNLPVTDIVWEQWIKSRAFEKEEAFGERDRVLFTVSLGRPFEKRDDCCYKLVAGVVVIPAG